MVKPGFLSWACYVVVVDSLFGRAPRFLFILLGPLGKGPQYHEIGRSIATLMTDEVGLTANRTGELSWSMTLYTQISVVFICGSIDCY